MAITNSTKSFYTANSSVSSTVRSTNEVAPLVKLHGKLYHLTISYKRPNQSEWEEITDSYLKLANRADLQEILQKQIKVPCKNIEITTSIYPNANSICNIQDANGRTRKVAGFNLTGFQNAKIFKILEKIKNPRSISRSKEKSLETLNSSSIKMSLEETKIERTQDYLEQAANFNQNRKELYKPVGFKNKSMNCGFNSCLQMILNEPVLLDIYSAVASYYAKSTKAEDQTCGKQMLSILDAYDRSLEEQKPISAEVSNNLRLAMHYLNKEISLKPGTQEDANEILTILFAKNDDIMKKQESVNTSSINYTFENVEHYECKRALQEKPHKDYSSLHPDNTYRRERSNYGIKINFDAQQKDYKLSSLLKKYFCDEDIGTGSDLRRYMVNGVYTEVSPVKEEIKLNVLPKDLLINFARFKADRTKFTSPLEIPEQLDAKLLNVKDHPDGLYELSSFIVHLGATLNGGHYIAYRKIEDQWMKYNDGKVSYLSKREMLNAVKDSYICFYKLKENLI